jgi:hypothetical protein
MPGCMAVARYEPERLSGRHPPRHDDRFDCNKAVADGNDDARQLADQPGLQNRARIGPANCPVASALSREPGWDVPIDVKWS